MATEVFNNIGESEIYSQGPNYNRRYNRDDDFCDNSEDVEKEADSKPMAQSKKEFIEHLNDDSLTLDKCGRINHDWAKK